MKMAGFWLRLAFPEIPGVRPFRSDGPGAAPGGLTQAGICRGPMGGWGWAADPMRGSLGRVPPSSGVRGWSGSGESMAVVPSRPTRRIGGVDRTLSGSRLPS